MKKITLVLSFAASLAVLSACGGGSSDTAATPTPAVATDGSCKIVDGIYQVTQAGCKTPDNAVCTASGISVTNGNATFSAGPTGTLNLYGNKYKCAA